MDTREPRAGIEIFPLLFFHTTHAIVPDGSFTCTSEYLVDSEARVTIPQILTRVFAASAAFAVRKAGAIKYQSQVIEY